MLGISLQCEIESVLAHITMCENALDAIARGSNFSNAPITQRDLEILPHP